MTSNIKIYYWPMAGRAGAAIRMLEEAKVDFTHVSSVEEIKQIAAAFGGNSTTFAPPILVDGDAIVSQSSAVAMYVGQTYGFDVPVGKTPLACQYMADFGDFSGECLSKLESDKAAEFITGRMMVWIGLFERYFGETTFLFGDKPTYPDFLMHAVFSYLRVLYFNQLKEQAGIDVFAETPKLKAAFTAIDNLESVQTTKIQPAGSGVQDKIASEVISTLQS